MEDRDELAAFEAMERGGPPATEPLVVFSERSAAERFAQYLTNEAKIEAESLQRRGADQHPYWDISANNRLAVDVLHRFFQIGTRVGDLPGLPIARRMQMLREVLTSWAIRRGNWGEPGKADLRWYGEAAQLSGEQLRVCASRAKEQFYSQHATEKSGATWLGLGFLLAAGVWALASGMAVGPIFCGVFGGVFVVFSLTRKSRHKPQQGQQKRL